MQNYVDLLLRIMGPIHRFYMSSYMRYPSQRADWSHIIRWRQFVTKSDRADQECDVHGIIITVGLTLRQRHGFYIVWRRKKMSWCHGLLSYCQGKWQTRLNGECETIADGEMMGEALDNANGGAELVWSKKDGCIGDEGEEIWRQIDSCLTTIAHSLTS